MKRALGVFDGLVVSTAVSGRYTFGLGAPNEGDEQAEGQKDRTQTDSDFGRLHHRGTMSRKAKTPAEGPKIVLRKRKTGGEPEMQRLFAGLALHPTARDAIEKAIEGPRKRLPSFNWQAADKWHITLQFLGLAPVDRIEALAQALADCRDGRIPVELRAMGAFPDMRGPKVLWVGVKDQTKGLVELHRRLIAATGKLGFESDGRRFTPHITVARARGGPGHPVARELTPLLDTTICQTVLSELVLFRSVLGEGGASYTPLKRFELGPKEG